MNITRQKVGLSFSIGNILQDDFCHSRRRDVPLCISARKILSLVPTILYNPFHIELKSRQNYNDVRNDSEWFRPLDKLPLQVNSLKENNFKL